MAEPKVSVVIPAYNSAQYLKEAIESVLTQSYPPWEVIVVDDGSTDGTAGVLKSYRDVVRYLSQKNRGEPAARNLGIRSAVGEFVAFLDADDLWLPGKLKLQMDYFTTHPECALVYTDMKTFDETGVLDESMKERFKITFPSGTIFGQLFSETLFGSGSVVFRKACVEKVGLFDERFLVGSDYEMWLRIARHFEVGYIDKPLLMYRQHAGMSTRELGRSLRNGVPWETAVLKQILRLYPEAIDELGRKRVNQRMSKPYANLAHVRFQQSDYPNARGLFREAIGYWPSNIRYWVFYLATLLRPSQVAVIRRGCRRLFASAVVKTT